MANGRRANDETQLDVDRMILDYLTFMAEKALFDEYENRVAGSTHSYGAVRSTQIPLQLVQCMYPLCPPFNLTTSHIEAAFVPLFKSNFPSERLEPAPSFRVKLLQFTALFSERSMPDVSAPCQSALESLRTTSFRRPGHFVASPSSCPLHRSLRSQLPISTDYRAYHVDVLRKNGATGISPSLLDLQPLFLKLSAARGILERNTTIIKKTWMHLAGQFMLQSCLEQLLVNGTAESGVLREAFSWGWEGEKSIDEMFETQSEDEETEWEEIRTSWARLVSGTQSDKDRFIPRLTINKQLTPTSRSTLLGRHLLSVAAEYPLHKFERDLLNFLEMLHQELAPPLMVQLENGVVEGLSLEETQQLMMRARMRF
jgi:hypothetical protein